MSDLAPANDVVRSTVAFLAKLIDSWFRYGIMDSDKKTQGFCKAELRTRFRLVFYLGKLSLAAYSEQFGKPGRNPTGPAHASRLVFTDHNRPPTAAMRPLLATTRQSSAMAKSGSSGKASFPCRMLETHRLAYPPSREYRFRNQSGTATQEQDSPHYRPFGQAITFQRATSS